MPIIWYIRQASRSRTFTYFPKIFFLPRLDFFLPLRTATVICEDGYQLKKPSNNKVRKIFCCTNIISEKYSFAQILCHKNILLHKYYFTFCLSWFVVRTVAGQLALVMNFQDVRWAKEKKIIIFLPRCQVAR